MNVMVVISHDQQLALFFFSYTVQSNPVNQFYLQTSLAEFEAVDTGDQNYWYKCLFLSIMISIQLPE